MMSPEVEEIICMAWSESIGPVRFGSRNEGRIRFACNRTHRTLQKTKSDNGRDKADETNRYRSVDHRYPYRFFPPILIDVPASIRKPLMTWSNVVTRAPVFPPTPPSNSYFPCSTPCLLMIA